MAFNFGTSILPTNDNTFSLGSASKRWKINDQEITFDTIYPIGAIYMSMNSTNPGALFGGTWEQITGKFLLACDTTYGAGTTGGSSTVSLQVENLPSHTHSVGAHAHGLNSHTHTGPSHTHTGPSHTHGLNGHTHTGPSHTHTGPSHSHGLYTALQAAASNYGCTYQSGSVSNSRASNGEAWTNTKAAGTGATGAAGTGSTGGNSGNTTASGTGATGASGTGATGGPSVANTANSTAFNSGSTGSGTAHNNMPPYLAIYVWQRVA